jgi:ubiquinone/menaquinone biosynthesis C-methylase UbiE
MKNIFPKKTSSRSPRGDAHKGFGAGNRRNDTRDHERSDRKERSSPRPYTANVKYGVSAKTSSYRGKDFRSQSIDDAPKTYSSTPSASPKSVYIKTERVEVFSKSPVRTGSRKKVSAISENGVFKMPKANHQRQSDSSDTSWGTVASWYNDHLEKTGDTYHEKVVYPNLLRLLGDVKGKKVLDLACGQGQFSRILRTEGAYVTGVDLGKELIDLAEANNPSIKEAGTHKITYFHGSADDLFMLKNGAFDIVVCILALQNIEKLHKTLEEVSRVLTLQGTCYFVINHPSFRVPRMSHWGYDERVGVQYRRVDEYMSESHVKIDMTPGSKSNKKYTVTFHRPLQVYIKALTKAGFALTHLEEWISHKESEKGPRQKSENNARKEIPLFMCIEGKRMGSSS